MALGNLGVVLPSNLDIMPESTAQARRDGLRFGGLLFDSLPQSLLGSLDKKPLTTWVIYAWVACMAELAGCMAELAIYRSSESGQVKAVK